MYNNFIAKSFILFKMKNNNIFLSYYIIIILRNVVYIHVNPLLISHGTYIMLTVRIIGI